MITAPAGDAALLRLTLPTPRTPMIASDPRPDREVNPPVPRQTPKHLQGMVTTTDAGGHIVAAGTIGQLTAGMLRQLDRIDELPDLTEDELTRDLTLSMQAYAATAPVSTLDELIPFLARTLVMNGWVG